MNKSIWQSLLNARVVIGMISVTGLLIIITFLSIGWTRPNPIREFGFAPADLTIIPAPSSTPNVTPPPTLDPLLAGTATLAPNVIGVGGYVQITGTEGDGLRLRTVAGLNGEPAFLGFDEEVFQVIDGPQDSDGYVWWYLVAPYDEARAGWAVADFLVAIPSP